ncbi:hypothetical protein [Arsenicicoccus sp. oral taxon 190]|nr:hypothetical protein [Arsenicicoccus sp. oral taxon 190]
MSTKRIAPYVLIVLLALGGAQAGIAARHADAATSASQSISAGR